MDEKLHYILRKNLASILTGGLLLAVIVFLSLIFFGSRYQGQSDVLIIQNHQGFVDSYTLSKSAEYFSKILAQTIHSETFINEVIKNDKIKSDFLPRSKFARIEKWKKVIKIQNSLDLGIISISVKGDSPQEITDLSETILKVITDKNELFRGVNQDIEARVLSGPIIKRNPGMFKLILGFIGGFFLGSLLSVFYFYYRGKIRRTVEHSRTPRGWHPVK